MCFSATASFTAGAVIGAMGLVTLPLVKEPRERLFAGIPLLFGIHQLLEGVIWLQVDAAGGGPIRTPAVAVWLLIAWVLWPIWVPTSVFLMEPLQSRRRMMRPLVGLGLAIGALLLIVSVTAAVTVRVADHHLEYFVPARPGWFLVGPYALAICGAAWLSSRRFVALFGVGLTLALAVTVFMDARQLSSVWCFFAAALSGAIFVHYALERFGGHPEPVTFDVAPS